MRRNYYPQCFILIVFRSYLTNVDRDQHYIRISVRSPRIQEPTCTYSLTYVSVLITLCMARTLSLGGD